MSDEVHESTTVSAPSGAVFAALSDVRRMTRWSTECFAVWVTRRRDGRAERFVGWNRRGPYLWFTTCRVVTADPGREFAFDVTTFGQPVSRWGFRLSPTADGAGTVVTEYWLDRRNGIARALGRVFTGSVATRRPQANRDGIRQTLQRLRADVEDGSAR